MEKKFKLNKNGQPLSMPCTKEQWEALKPELDEIEGVDYQYVTDTFEEEPFLVNDCFNNFALVGNVRSIIFNLNHLPTHDKEAFLSSLRGEPIKKEVTLVLNNIIQGVKQESPFNDEYWEKLYHECAVKFWVSEQCATASDAAKYAKMLIEELKNNPLK